MMNKLIVIKPFLEIIISTILKVETKTLAIFIFGSYVNGTPNEDSDIDICVIVPDENILTNDELINNINEKLLVFKEHKFKSHVLVEHKTIFNTRAQLPTIAKVIYNQGVCIYGNISLQIVDNVDLLQKDYIIQMFLRIDDRVKILNDFPKYISANELFITAYAIMMDCLRVFVMYHTNDKPKYSNVTDKLLKQCILLDSRFAILTNPCNYLAHLYFNAFQSGLFIIDNQCSQSKIYAKDIRNALPLIDITGSIKYSKYINFSSIYLD